MNPPIAWALTAAEITLGGWIASLGYPVVGGFIMGLAAGSFLSRAATEAILIRYLKDNT